MKILVGNFTTPALLSPTPPLLNLNILTQHSLNSRPQFYHVLIKVLLHNQNHIVTINGSYIISVLDPSEMKVVIDKLKKSCLSTYVLE